MFTVMDVLKAVAVHGFSPAGPGGCLIEYFQVWQRFTRRA